jgi:hypothetical protein
MNRLKAVWIKSYILVALGSAAFCSTAPGQETNVIILAPQTRLEAFDTNTGIVVIKASFDVGTVAANNGGLAIKCREITDASTGRREYGISIELDMDGGRRDVRMIDYEEIQPLLGAVDYLNRVDWSVTTLSSFDALYTTKSGFRVAAFSSRRSGVIEFAVRSVAAETPRLVLSRDQVAVFRNVLQQAKEKLDTIRQSK